MLLPLQTRVFERIAKRLHYSGIAVGHRHVINVQQCVQLSYTIINK